MHYLGFIRVILVLYPLYHIIIFLDIAHVVPYMYLCPCFLDKKSSNIENFLTNETQKSFASDHELLMQNRILLLCLSKFRRQCSLCETYFYYFFVFLRVKEESVRAFSGRIGPPPAVMGWATSCDDGP